MKVLFMGTPDFAVSSLCALADAGYDIVGVVTQPDKPKGRGYTLMPPPVKEEAVRRGFRVYQPNTLRDGAFEGELCELSPDVIIVAAYGKILPEYVINFPRLGCINVHASLLPKYRGAAPIQRSIIDGERITGITIMHMDTGLDTGDIISQAETEITAEDNFETLHDRLASIGAELLLSTLDSIARGTADRIKQDDALSTYASKIEKSDCVIDFSSSATAVHNLIRGLSPVPLAVTFLNELQIKAVRSVVLDRERVCEPGEVLSLADGIIAVGCGRGVIGISELLPAGKKKMSSADFIRGRRISVGDKLGSEK